MDRDGRIGITPKPIPPSGALATLKSFDTSTLFSRDGRLDSGVVSSFLSVVKKAVDQRPWNKAAIVAGGKLNQLLSINNLPITLPACWKERTKWDVAINIHAIVGSPITQNSISTAKNEFYSRCEAKRSPEPSLNDYEE